MLKAYLALLLFLSTHLLFGQGIVFETGPFDNILSKAKKERKLIFLHIDSPSCLQCTEVATQGFSNPALTEKFAINFVSYRVSGGSDEGKALMARYELRNSLVSLFLASDGSLLNRYDGSTSFAYTYLEQADKAIAKRDLPSLNQLDTQFASGDRSEALLKSYIQRRNELRLPIDALLDIYVRQLSSETRNSESTFHFLFEQVPVLGSYADSVFRSDNQVWHERFMTYPLDRRIAFNRTLNSKTMAKAIATKNTSLARRAASYNAGTYGNNYRSGQWAYEGNMMQFHLGVKDTTAYIASAKSFYDRFIMPLNPDSITQAEQKKRFEVVRSQPSGINTVVQGPVSVYGRDLNQAAWRFWQMATKTEDLEKALSWSKRSLEYYEDPNWIDTYARLLYKLNQREEALLQQRKAVLMMQQRKGPVTSFEKTLQKMQDGTLVPEPD